MKILMVGAGAVGGFFGALLHKSGADITFMVRPETFEIIKAKGLTIENGNNPMTVYPKLIQAGEMNTSFDLIILAVKCYDLDEVFVQIKPGITERTLIMSLQNGIDTEERLISRFGDENIIGGVAFITAKLIEKGRIGHFKRGIITIGELNGVKSDRLSKIHRLLTEAGITAFMTSHIMQKKWEKLCWNATFNPLSVILNGPVSDILESPGASSVIRAVIEEIINVSKANGILLKESIIEDTIRNSYELKDFHTSMYEDWKYGKITENQYLNGIIYKKAIRAKIAAPMNYLLFMAIEAITLKPQAK